jgi:hypothetical protein
MALAASRFSGVRSGLLTAKGVGLAMVLSVLLLGLLAQAMYLGFQFGDATVALATTRACRLSRSHGELLMNCSAEVVSAEMLAPRCTFILAPLTRGTEQCRLLRENT